MACQKILKAIALAFGVLIGALPPTCASAFQNGQSAVLVLGQRDFTEARTATTRRGENGPSAVGFDSAGDLWVSDQCNSRMLEFKPPFQTDMKPSVVIGEPDFQSTSSPEICFSTDILPTHQAAVFSYNDKFTFDAAGRLWVADGGNNRVLAFAPPFKTGMQPFLVLGQPDFTSGEAATTASGFNFPTEPAFDSAGNLWVADVNNNRVLEFRPPFSNGMSATLVLGQKNFTASDCVTTSTGFCEADSIAFNSKGNLFVADAFGNNRVLQFKPPFHTGMKASRVIGQPDFVSNGAGTSPNQLNFNDGSGLAVDANDNLWVGDSGNNRLLEFPNVNGIVKGRAVLVIGQPDFVSNAAATSQTGLWIPVRPAFDLIGNLWLSDANNSRILQYRVLAGSASLNGAAQLR